MALIGKGIRVCRAFRKPAAVVAVARVWASTTSQRETTSRAVNPDASGHAGERAHVQGVHLHQVPRLPHRIALGLADGIGTAPEPLPGGATRTRRLPEHPACFEPGEDAADHGGGDHPVLAAQSRPVGTCPSPSGGTAPAGAGSPAPARATRWDGAPAGAGASAPPGSLAGAAHSAVSSGRRSGGSCRSGGR